MSTNCLVTKLKGVVVNDNLPVVGEMIVEFGEVASPSKYSQCIVVKTVKATTAKVDNGYFTDSTLRQNLGTGLSIPKYTETQIFVSNGATLHIFDKYSIYFFATYGGGPDSAYSKIKFDYFDLSFRELEHLNTRNTAGYGNITKVIPSPYCNVYSLSNSCNGTIDLSNFGNSLTHIYLQGNITLQGSFSGLKDSIVITIDNNCVANFDTLFPSPINAKGLVINSSSIPYTTTQFANAFANGDSITSNLKLNNSAISGSIVALGKFINTNNVNVRLSSITGAVEDLLNEMKTNGKVSSIVYVTCNGIVTYNGTINSSNLKCTFDANGDWIVEVVPG